MATAGQSADRASPVANDKTSLNVDMLTAGNIQANVRAGAGNAGRIATACKSGGTSTPWGVRKRRRLQQRASRRRHPHDENPAERPYLVNAAANDP